MQAEREILGGGVYETHWQSVEDLPGKLRIALATVGDGGHAILYVPGDRMQAMARAIEDGAAARAGAARMQAALADLDRVAAQANALAEKAIRAERRALGIAFVAASVAVAAVLLMGSF